MKIQNNAPKTDTGTSMTPKADNSTLTSNIGPEFHERKSTTQGLEYSYKVNDGTGLCK
ncbi:hypothetical protein ACO0LG_08675 [Undibacterium sp. Ji42W]|uniref:hypothetical protein n=1 Tax=Undibacterium sp. Ji42W TaxID=3413039 RepID=UPI003BF3DD5C